LVLTADGRLISHGKYSYTSLSYTPHVPDAPPGAEWDTGALRGRAAGALTPRSHAQLHHSVRPYPRPSRHPQPRQVHAADGVNYLPTPPSPRTFVSGGNTLRAACVSHRNGASGICTKWFVHSLETSQTCKEALTDGFEKSHLVLKRAWPWLLSVDWSIWSN